MKINKIFESFAKSKTGQKFYKWTNSEKAQKFINLNLAQAETVLSTGAYIYSTAKQDLPPRQKTNLQYQNIGSGLVGLLLAGTANRWVYKKGEEIIKDLDPKKLDPKSIRKISTGLRVFLPLATTALCMRWLIPCAVSVLSSVAVDKTHKKDDKTLDTKV